MADPQHQIRVELHLARQALMDLWTAPVFDPVEAVRLHQEIRRLTLKLRQANEGRN